MLGLVRATGGARRGLLAVASASASANARATSGRQLALATARATSGRQLATAASPWKGVPLGPPDKILGLNELFKEDKNPLKVNLGVGAYRDDDGKPLVLKSVKEAERRIVDKNMDHEYAGIAGVQSFVDRSVEFAFGSISPVIKSGRVAAVQALSGTGGCRLAGEFVARFLGGGSGGLKMYMPDPTWGNHGAIMKDAGLVPAKYTYYDSKRCAYDHKGFLSDLSSLPEGSVFMLHACAHNPTGCDPSPQQWDELSAAFAAKKHVAFFDCAYPGFASGDSEKDAYGLRKFVSDGHNVLLAQSFAKNFGLYGERIGTFAAVTASKEETDRVLSQMKLLVRPMYSNPPVHGARIVSEILTDAALRKQWTAECKAMADRILLMRSLLRDNLKAAGSAKNWQHITDQIGMFAFTGLSPEQVLRMRSEFSIYCTEDGRISIAGVNSKNVAHVAKAMHAVTK